jgi:hypothetical protein
MQCMAEQSARIDLRLFDADIVEGLRHQPGCLGDRDAGLQPGNDAHAAPAAASSSA